MFGLGWTEIIIIALAAFIFLKPEDLPKAMRKIGRLFGKIRSYMESVTKEIDSIGDDDTDETVKKRFEGMNAAGRRRKRS